jgi:hypothetical protein
MMVTAGRMTRFPGAASMDGWCGPGDGDGDGSGGGREGGVVVLTAEEEWDGMVPGRDDGVEAVEVAATWT